MVDWVTCDLPLSKTVEVNGGRIIAVDQYGAREWATDRRLPIVGSYDAAVYVRTKGNGLELSGNPSKFLQGHNLFGSPDVRGLVYQTALRVCREVGVKPHYEDLSAWLAGHYDLRRVDCTRMFALEDRAQVRRWLVAVGQIAHGRHQKVTQYDGQTVYLGKHSRRSTLKAYCKGDELQIHPLPAEMPQRACQRLTEYADNKLRVELSVRSMTLRDLGLRRASSWTLATGARLLAHYISRLEVSDIMALDDNVAESLPKGMLGVYHRWRAGEDMRATMSRRTFYRWRARFLPYGVDIAITRPRLVEPETRYLLGAPLKSFIEGPGEPPPAWARRERLLA
jgi:II/X family phage/plasmid replication protein